MSPKNFIFALAMGACLWIPQAARSQEIPEVKGVHIQIEKSPWEKTEASPEPRSFEPKDLSGLLEELFAYNPELRAVIEKIRSLENKVGPAGALDDPRISLEGSNIPISPPALNRTAMTGLQLYYRQKVPWPGKLKLKNQIAQTQANQEKEEYYERLNQLVAKFKRTYFDYRLTTDLISVYGSTEGQLGGLDKFLEARYSAGETPQQDILQNKVEISSLKETLVELKQRRKILLARMNTLLNRPLSIELKLKRNTEPATPLQAPLKELLEIARRTRPWLKKSALEIQQADYEHKLAKKGLLPDFDFAAGWRFRQNSPGDPVMGEDFFSAGFSINLPVFAGKKQNKEIAAAFYQKRMQEHLKEATTQEVYYQVEKIYHRLTQLKSQLRILNSRTLPQARAAVHSSQVGYEANQVDFLNVLTNVVALLDQKLKQVQYRYEYEKSIADLEMATGLPIHLLNEMQKAGEYSDENS